jgi:hypothetical protein
VDHLSPITAAGAPISAEQQSCLLEAGAEDAARLAAFRRWQAKPNAERANWPAHLTVENRAEIAAVARFRMHPEVYSIHLARAVEALLNHPAPETVLPPVEPTSEMIRAGVDELGEAMPDAPRAARLVEEVWSRMIAVAPVSGHHLEEALSFFAAFRQSCGCTPTMELWQHMTVATVDARREARELRKELAAAHLARDAAVAAAQAMGAQMPPMGVLRGPELSDEEVERLRNIWLGLTPVPSAVPLPDGVSFDLNAGSLPLPMEPARDHAAAVGAL